MIDDKMDLTLTVLTKYPETRGDGHGKFLNKVYALLHKDTPINFESFNSGSWSRARRKVLEQNNELDERTIRTARATNQVISEVI